MQEDAPCRGIEAGARLVREVALALGDRPRDLLVWAVARSPVGIGAPALGICRAAAAGRTVSIKLMQAKGDVLVAIYGVDVRGEAAGQSGPYVMGITENQTPTRSETPSERSRLGPKDVTIRWLLKRKECSESYMKETRWQCYEGYLELSGAYKRRMKLPRALEGQQGCWPLGIGIVCGGASGGSTLALTLDSTGLLTLTHETYSDGYCEEGEKCGNVERWIQVQIESQLRLVADPRGTWP